MPTARELLEQADALMRRNRGREPEPDIPELTDEVAVAEAMPAARRGAKSPATAAVLRPEADDVPELTEAVSRIEEVLIQPPPDEGVDSDWLESELGGASITGPAPDSIAVVPPATLRPAEPASDDVAPSARPRGHSDEHKLAPETAAAMLAASLASPPAAHVDGPAGADDPAFDAMLGLHPADAEFEREFASPPPVEATEAPMELGDVEQVEVVEAVEVVEVVEEVEVVEVVEEVQAPGPVAEPSEVPIAAAIESPPPAESKPAPAPSWEAVAEEIRMQVLQRIDIFTDTGLQGELAARLQPVVDRASADLIATINREVGQLLRAYVAEAIEREIEKWRESNP